MTTATMPHFRVEVDDRERVALGKVLRVMEKALRHHLPKAWDAQPQDDGSIVLRPRVEVAADAVTKLSPKAWDELQSLMERPAVLPESLRAAAIAYRDATASGRLISQPEPGPEAPKPLADESTVSTRGRTSTTSTASTTAKKKAPLKSR